MRTYIEKLESLNGNSCWVFTKQDTDFDQAFKAVKLFSEIPDKESINIENYFEKNHSRYGIDTDRHRMLVIPQMYGLLTKTPFYVRGGNYSAENPTEVFDLNKIINAISNSSLPMWVSVTVCVSNCRISPCPSGLTLPIRSSTGRKM